MGRRPLESRKLIAASVALVLLVLLVCQIFLAMHFHPSQPEGDNNAAAYACVTCFVKASGNDTVGPVPFAPVVLVSQLQTFVGFVPRADLLPSLLLPSGNWARGPPLPAR
jgi:hypothetical protein